MSVAAYIWRRQFSFLPGWLKPLFFGVFCFFLPSITGWPSYRVLPPSHRTIVYHHIGTWGRRPPRWCGRSLVGRAMNHDVTCQSCTLYLGLLASHPLFTSGCGIRIVRHLPCWPACQTVKISGCMLIRPPDDTRARGGGRAISTRALCLPFVPILSFLSHRPARSAVISRKLEPGR